MTTIKPSPSEFTPVYGPVSSWRYGKSLDISKIETGRDSKMVKLDFTPMRDE
jgi:hypothetical protein